MMRRMAELAFALEKNGEIIGNICMKYNIHKMNDDFYEYCPRCDANLTLQKGYSSELPYWICKGCGEMLINPDLETESDIIWRCDKCGALLNIQPEFSEDCGEWGCRECGFINKIDVREIFASEDEYKARQFNPYKGLSDSDVLRLSLYREECPVEGKDNVFRVKNAESGETFIKKLLWTYDRSVYEYIMDHPIHYMPRIREIFESDNCLIVIEEYIEGHTVDYLIEQEVLSKQDAVCIAKSICAVLDTLHSLSTPIIHRDIKPSNIIVTESKEVYLLDMNVAKWYRADKNDDTRYLGTPGYAAPEQVGYGLSASSAKSDVYAVGILLNVMLTGSFPREEHAAGMMGDIIDSCISLDPKIRPTAAELKNTLEKITF